VLFSEYVKVLVARGVIDATTAEQLNIGFYAAHYGDLDAEDLRVSEAITRLEDVTARLAAMPLDARLELSLQVQCDLRTLSENAARSATAQATVAAEPAWEPAPLAATDRLWDLEPPSHEFADEDERLILSVAVNSADSASKRRRVQLLSLLTFAAFGLFFAGYASSGPIKKFLQRNGTDVAPLEAAHEKPNVVEREQPKEVVLRNLAVTEANLRHAQKASLAYELLLAYQPEDALTLNNLAWLYLTTQDPAVHNSQRGLELSKRAITFRRSPEFLDTAAEAHFQTGNPQEAVTLEKEALEPPALGSFRPGLDAELRRRLQKFEAALAPRSLSTSTPSGGPVPTSTQSGGPVPPSTPSGGPAPTRAPSPTPAMRLRVSPRRL
jgi:hypothetical protein